MELGKVSCSVRVKCLRYLERVPALGGRGNFEEASCGLYVQRDCLKTIGFRSLWRLGELMSRLAGNVADALLQSRESEGLLNGDPLKNRRILEQPGWEGASKDHLVQPVAGKGA